MKPSTQFMIGAAGLGVVAFVLWRGAAKAGEVAGQVVGAVGTAANAVNPFNNDNIIAGAVNSVGATVARDDSWTLGGWIYDLTHGDENAKIAEMLKPAPTTQSASQSQYARPITSSGGASAPIPAPLAFWGDGASFKDLSSSGDVNIWSPY